MTKSTDQPAPEAPRKNDRPLLDQLEIDANEYARSWTGQEHVGRNALYAITLAAATIGSALWAGWVHGTSYGRMTNSDNLLLHAIRAAAYTAALLATVVLHEWGHYRMATLWRVRCQLPYLIPAPNLPGTFGAVMQILERPRTRGALLEIAAAGPTAGLVVAIPATIIGLLLSETVSIQNQGDWLWNESLLTGWLREWCVGPVGTGQIVALHPLALAGYIGLLITSINLLPIAPLDGGQIVRTIAGSEARTWWLGFGTATALIAAGMTNGNWAIWGWIGVLLVYLSKRLQVSPETEWESPMTGQLLWAAALGAFALISFTPAPITWVGGN